MKTFKHGEIVMIRPDNELFSSKEINATFAFRKCKIVCVRLVAADMVFYQILLDYGSGPLELVAANTDLMEVKE